MSGPVIEGDTAEIVARELPWENLAGATVLVTGAGGMLPSYVLRTLLALNDQRGLGIRVLALVRDGAKAGRVLGDVLDRADVTLVVADVTAPLADFGPVDYVIHGASPARPALHAADPVATLRANLLGTLNLLERCVHDRSRAFVLMSSAEVYGHQPPGVELIDESSYGGFDILDPRACYSEGKRAAETMCAVYQAQHGLTCRIARFGHVYGPGMALDDGRVQADFAASVVAGRDIVLNSDGSSVRTYTYVADAVAGLFYALLRGDEVVYNVADARGLVSIRQLATLFTEVRTDVPVRLRFTDSVDERAYSPSKSQGLDSTRLTELGWQAMVDLPTGLARMVAALRS